ncbi:hypothetical protein COU77_00340 [Candidatus Peregrinibacteria bacterium CG10_big_fil_rev_8_21_14_0_10_49_16]|nr:MAG: hypothetical protein COW95_04375 [Candidatus Peregrinibacteria bacterium CG22_combo_CG10-13_8_21_14_all_49_11]PIR52436.1 MAG: hypothetical protein COU77_00340 [Candidatus Peregrinibacteria bacterium CG10_big_fil_rev_8_21_14_0_10_49_16]
MSKHPLTRLEFFFFGGLVVLLLGIAVAGWKASEDSPLLRNEKRQQDIERILDSLYQYAVDHRSLFPQGITSGAQEICQFDALDCTGLVDLSDLAPYIAEAHLLIDPFALDNRSTEYRIQKMEDGKVRVSAPNAEMGEEIFVER